MPNPLKYGLSLVRGAKELPGKPFYSAVDKAIDSLPNKALPDQFIKEMLKLGAKPQEIIDRKLDVVLGAPIVQRTRTVKLKKPDAKGRTEKEEKYFEVTPSEKGTPSITRQEVENAVNANPPPLVSQIVSAENDYYVRDPITGRIIAEDLSLDDAADEAERIGGDFGSFGTGTKFPEYTLPGGENYREIKLTLPVGENKKFFGPHFTEPNILAHARVSDRVGPNGERILHIEEIQSDWHQKGREKGYGERTKRYEKEYDEYLKDLKQRYQDRLTATYAPGEKDPIKQYEMIPASLMLERDPEKMASVFGESEIDKLRDKFALVYQERSQKKLVPDAPFKKDWHELVLKRLVDDAAKKGYDKVVITPGSQQVKRYEDEFRKSVDRIEFGRSGDRAWVNAYRDGENIFGEDLRPQNGGWVSAQPIEGETRALEEIVGKDIANRFSSGEATTFEGADLTIGGEGMKGFYDLMVPSAINKMYGKYGVKVSPYELSVPKKDQRFGLPTENIGVHSFDITPELRQSVLEKGQPLYQVAPLVPAGAAALGEEEPPQYRKGGKVKVKGLNIDAMSMAVMDKQLRKRHG
jgi:hypothetical protein